MWIAATAGSQSKQSRFSIAVFKTEAETGYLLIKMFLL